MFPIWNPRYKQRPHCRFRLGNIPSTRKHDATWNKRVNFDFHPFISSYSAPEMFLSWNHCLKRLPHCRLRLLLWSTPGIREHHLTWNKLVKLDFYPLILSYRVTETQKCSPTWNRNQNRSQRQCSHCQFGLVSIPGILSPVPVPGGEHFQVSVTITHNKWIKV